MQWLMNDHGVDVGSFQDLQQELSELPGSVFVNFFTNIVLQFHLHHYEEHNAENARQSIF
jgi:hypothetical protein